MEQLKNSLSFSVSCAEVIPTNKAIIESALPRGYVLKRQIGNGWAVYSVTNDDFFLGVAEVIDGKVVFQLNDNNDGQWLARKLGERYPSATGDQLLWAIFFQWYDKWSMVGAPSCDVAVLLQRLNLFHLSRNAILCSFRRKDFDGKAVLAETRHKIMDNWLPCEIDEGPTLIEITDLEVHEEESEEDLLED